MHNITFNIDSKYVVYCQILIKSILNHNDRINFHILHSGLSDIDKEQISSSVSNADVQSKVDFYYVDDTTFSHMPKTSQWPTTIYYRIMIAELLSENIDKVLYLDCDILVRGSLDNLFNTCLDGYGVAAVEDILSPIAPMIESINADPLMGYFNSGVMLLNLKYWRENNVVEKIIKFINDNLDIIRHPDQDAINSILNMNWKKVHYKWNFLKNYQNIYFCKEHLDKDLNKQSINYPVIVHFSGVKPWSSKCRSAFKFEYHNVMRQLGMNEDIPKATLFDKLEYIVVKLLDATGLKKCRVNYFV
ncbi:glycosyltransferase family 8 protein [Vibrio fluvialis]|nr:glycosyltransferase family 8 protein [Vibrio fluvialis]